MVSTYLLNYDDNNDLDPEHISSLKYAPIISVDVERTFSSYKNILSDRRQKFSVQNLEKHLIINWYNNGNAASIRGTFPDSALLSEIFAL
jgi:hypothetical protein